MVGKYQPEKLQGITFRTFNYLFKKIEEIENNESSTFNINVSFIQIYIDKIQDLLEPKNKVKVREDPNEGVLLHNCSYLNVKNEKDCKKIFEYGEKNRVTAFTKMNIQSSRSHALFIISVEKYFMNEEDQKKCKIKGILHLVDLAGSERVNKSGSKDIRLEEAKKINFSLSALGKCIQSLISPNKSYVPYRDNKLTFILKDSLGGNSKTSLIITISPSNYNEEESLSSLYFGQNAIKVKNNPKINKFENNQFSLFKSQEEYNHLMEQYKKIFEENQKLNKLIEMQRNSLKEVMKEEEYMEIFKEMEEKYNTEKNKITEQYDKSIIKKQEEIEQLNEELDEYKISNKNLNEELNNLQKQNEFLTEKNNELNKEIEDLRKYNNKINDKFDEFKNNNKNLKEELNDLKKQNVFLKEKNKELNIEIEDLKKYNNKIIRKNNELQNKYNDDKFIELEQKTKDLLGNRNINKNILDKLNSKKISKIIEDLLFEIEQKEFINKRNEKTNNKLNNYINEMENNNETKNKISALQNRNKKMEKKIKDLENENRQFRNKYSKSLDKINNIETKNSQLQIDYENKLKKMEDEKNKLNYYNKKLDEVNTQIENEYLLKIKNLENNKYNYEKMKNDYENKISIIKNDNKITSLNAHLNESEIKRMTYTIDIYEKLLAKNINLMLNDMNIFNIFKKEFKKMETIMDSDLPSIISSSYDYNINKAKNQINKIQKMIENIKNINNNNIIYRSNSIKENFDKLNKIIQENKEFMVNNYFLLNKVFNKVIDLYNKNKKINNNEQKFYKSNNDKNEENLKYEIIDIILQNLDELSPICYNTDNSDLKDELYKLKNNCNALNILDVLKGVKNILEKVVLRSKDFRNQKDLEIQNLNNKILYFLREINNYKKYFTSINNNSEYDEEKRLLNNELLLKDGEIIKLNKQIDILIKKIENLKNGNKKDYNNININNYNNTDFNNINNIDIINNDNNNYIGVNEDFNNLTNEEFNNNLEKYVNNIKNIEEQLKQMEDEGNKK